MTPSNWKPKTNTKGLFSLAKDHIWTFGAAGALLMIVHFARIGYLPTLSLADVGLIGAATVAFTVTFTILFLVVYLLPGIAYEIWGSARLIPKPRLVKKQERRKRVYPGTKGKKRVEGSGVSTFPLLISSYTGMALACITYYLASLCGEAATALFILILLLGFAVTGSTLTSGGTTLAVRMRKSVSGWKLRTVLLTWSLYSATLPIAYAVFTAIPSTSLGAGEFGIMVPIAIVPTAHYCIYVSSSLPNRDRVNAALYVGIYLTVAMGIAVSALDKSATRFQFGLLRDQTILVTQRGCDVLLASKVVQKCEKAGDNPSMMTAGPVDILTRLGSHMLISQPGWTYDHKTLAVPVKATEIDSWFPSNSAPEPDDATKLKLLSSRFFAGPGEP